MPRDLQKCGSCKLASQQLILANLCCLILRANTFAHGKLANLHRRWGRHLHPGLKRLNCPLLGKRLLWVQVFGSCSCSYINFLKISEWHRDEALDLTSLLGAIISVHPPTLLIFRLFSNAATSQRNLSLMITNESWASKEGIPQDPTPQIQTVG